jgi:hypothetical protein
MESSPSPKLTSIPLSTSNVNDNNPTGQRSVYIISNLLSETECEEIIKKHQHFTESNVSPGTIRTREQFDDLELSAAIWERMREFYETGEGIERNVRDEDGETWIAEGLNSRWRLCLYESGKYGHG